MRILLWGINYAPEAVGIGPFNRELCEYLVERGHAVSAVTSFPYYPRWRKEAADRGRWFRTESAGGVRVFRCGCYVPAAATALRRILHELSFGLVSTLRILVLPRADVYVVVSPPLALGFFAWLVTKVKRSRFVFHVQDLQPDAAVGLGMLRPGALVRLLYGLERLAYAKAAAVSGISEGMIAAFRRKGVSPAKRVLLPNWLRLAPGAPAAGAGESRADARRSLGVEDDDLLAVYAGNLGRKQSLEILIEAAFLLRVNRAKAVPAGNAETTRRRPALPSLRPPRENIGARIRLIIAGDGAARADLEQSLRDHPGVNVQLLPLLSDSRYADLLRSADVALITQVAGTGQFFFPSKLLSVLAAGLPVVAVADADSELARAIQAGGFGCAIRPGDACGLAALLGRLLASRAQLEAWAAHTPWVRQFSRESILPRFEQLLLAVARRPGADPAAEPKAIPA